MPQGGWLTSLREQAGAEIPAGLRLIAGAPLEPRFRSPTLGNIAVSIPGFVLGFFFSRFLAPASRGFRVRISSAGFFSF